MVLRLNYCSWLEMSVGNFTSPLRCCWNTKPWSDARRRTFGYGHLIEAVLDCLCANAREHRISFRWRPFLSDPADDFILELAVAAKAQYIVTHNLRDFVGVEAFGLEAITPAQMLAKLREAS